MRGTLSGLDVRRPIWRQPSLALVFVLMLAFVVGICAAGAASNLRVASLKIAVPASMARGSAVILKASGFSGQYNEVAFSSVQSSGAGCAAPGMNTIEMKPVTREHAFSVKLSNVFGAPGRLTLCVYLFTSGPNANDTKGHYIVRSAPLKVS